MSQPVPTPKNRVPASKNRVSGPKNNAQPLAQALGEAQRDSQAWMDVCQSFFQRGDEGILMLDERGRVVLASPWFVQQFGEKPGQICQPGRLFDVGAFSELFERSHTFQKWWNTSMATGERGQQDWLLADGEGRTLSVTSVPIQRQGRRHPRGWIWFFRDGTELANLRNSLQEAQKLEAIGRMTGGIAHDFNNLLAGVGGHVELMEMDLRESAQRDESIDPGSLTQHIQPVKQAVERGRMMIRQLMSYSRKSELELTPCDMNRLVLEVTELLRGRFSESVQIRLDLAPTVWTVLGDETRLTQVLTNLLVNARDAVGQSGAISVRTRNYVDKATHPVESRECVSIEIRDDGCGIPLEVMEHIFEPFFTTKRRGKGTGLGLSTSVGVIDQLGGWITVQSAVDEGSLFQVVLPRMLAEEGDETPAYTQVVTTTKGRNPGGRLLVADDDTEVRSVAEKLLRNQGYDVESASDGVQALEQLRENPEAFGAVLLDLSMPNLSGPEVLAAMKREGINVPVIVLSGYVDDLKQLKEEIHEPIATLSKPYDLRAVLQAVSEAVTRGDGLVR